MGCFGRRMIVWTSWALNAGFSLAYLGLSITTYYNIRVAVKYFSDFAQKEAFKTGWQAACILAFCLVLFWVIFSLIVLIRMFISNLPLAYGAMLSTCSHTGFFLLLAGLLLHGLENLANLLQEYDIWTASAYQTYVATYVFNYFLTGTYLIMFFILVVFSKTMLAEPDSSNSFKGMELPPNPISSGSASVPSGFNSSWSATPHYGQSV